MIHIKKRTAGNLAVFLISILLFVLLLSYSKHKNTPAPGYYAAEAEVTTINFGKEFVGLTDKRGIEWYLYEIEDWELGDRVLLVFNDHATAYLFDDEIVSARYNG